MSHSSDPQKYTFSNGTSISICNVARRIDDFTFLASVPIAPLIFRKHFGIVRKHCFQFFPRLHRH